MNQGRIETKDKRIWYWR